MYFIRTLQLSREMTMVYLMIFGLFINKISHKRLLLETKNVYYAFHQYSYSHLILEELRCIGVFSWKVYSNATFTDSQSKQLNDRVYHRKL